MPDAKDDDKKPAARDARSDDEKKPAAKSDTLSGTLAFTQNTIDIGSAPTTPPSKSTAVADAALTAVSKEERAQTTWDSKGPIWITDSPIKKPKKKSKPLTDLTKNINSYLRRAMSDVILNNTTGVFVYLVSKRPAPSEVEIAELIDKKIPLQCAPPVIFSPLQSFDCIYRSDLMESVAQLPMKPTKGGKHTPKMCNRQLEEKKMNLRCYVCWLNTAVPGSNKTNNKAEVKCMQAFYRKQFQPVQAVELASIEKSVLCNETLYIVSYANDLTKHIVAAVTYYTCPGGTYINWFAVSQEKRTNIVYGSAASNHNWRQIGMASFLLRLLQTLSAVKGWSSNIYLQANQDEDAFSYYLHRGFTKSVTNDFAKELPEAFQPALKASESRTKPTRATGYIHFVSTEEQENEIKPLDKEQRAKRRTGFLHLLRLDKHVRLSSSCIDLLDTSEDEHHRPVLHFMPPSQISEFMKFPFTILGQKIDNATEDFKIFGQPRFRFQNPNDMLCQILPSRDKHRSPEQRLQALRSVIVSTVTYTNLKEDTSKIYLNDELMNLFGAWMLRDTQSNLASHCEIVNTQIADLVWEVQARTSFDDNMRMPMQHIDRYLRANPELLTKRTIFFSRCITPFHWWGWLALNPWKQLLDAYDELDAVETKKQLPKTEAYLHGLLCSSPGYTYDDAAPLIWLLNLAAAYRDMRLSTFLRWMRNVFGFWELKVHLET